MASTFEMLSLKNDPAYIRGCRQIAAWHEQCRERRLGMVQARIKLEAKTKRTCFNWCGKQPGEMLMGNIAI